MKLSLLPLALLAVSPVFAQNAPQPAVVTFTYDRPGVPVPHFVLTVDESGHGHYQADAVEAVQEKYARYSDTDAKPEIKHIDRSLEVSHATVESIFHTAQSLNYFNVTCASRAKNIANTGDKSLSYTGLKGRGSCTYNYSDNKSVEALTDTFLDIAYTMDQGRKMDFDHRYDRLGLDADMEQLMQAVEEKRALELGNIASTLTAIIDDTAVMQRVRQRAAALLEQAKQTMQAAN